MTTLQALAIGLAREWTAPLADTIRTDTINSLQVINNGPGYLSNYNLAIIGHNSTWGNNEVDQLIIERLAKKTLLLQGEGGRQFLYLLKPDLHGLIAQTSGRQMRFEAPAGHAIWKTPHPIDTSGYEINLYADWCTQYGAIISRAGNTEIAGGAWGIHTIIRLAPGIAYFGYALISAVSELGQVWCNTVSYLLAPGDKQP